MYMSPLMGPKRLMYIYVRHVVKQRNRMLRKVRDVPGLVGDVVVGAPEEGREASKIMTPRLWFWHKFYMRPLAEDENKTLCATDFVRRVRGRELADGLPAAGGERRLRVRADHGAHHGRAHRVGALRHDHAGRPPRAQ